jgi:hypothetical protein
MQEKVEVPRRLLERTTPLRSLCAISKDDQLGIEAKVLLKRLSAFLVEKWGKSCSVGFVVL